MQISLDDPPGAETTNETFRVTSAKARQCFAKTIEGRAIANQLVRCGTSVAANYCATCRSRSKPEFVARMGIVLEEADETQLWLELIIEGRLLPSKRVKPLLSEASELVAICVSSRKSASANLKS